MRFRPGAVVVSVVAIGASLVLGVPATASTPKVDSDASASASVSKSKNSKKKPRFKKLKKRVISAETPKLFHIYHEAVGPPVAIPELPHQARVPVRVFVYTNTGVDQIEIRYVYTWDMVASLNEYRTATSRYIGTWKTPRGFVNKFALTFPLNTKLIGDQFEASRFSWKLIRDEKFLKGNRVEAAEAEGKTISRSKEALLGGGRKQPKSFPF